MPTATDLLRLSEKASAAKGIQPGTQFFTPFPFAGINTNGSGIAIDDREFRYVENFFRIGDGKLRAAWDVGSSLYTAPFGKTIISFFAFNIGSTNYFAVFLSDGTAVQVNAVTGVTTSISSVAGTFYRAGGSVPACSQWGTQYLLIGNNNTTNDYWVWDGVLLYSSGGAAPNGVEILNGGLNYSSLPTVTAFGGFGSGVVVVPVINAGSVVELNIANPGTGYQVGDFVQLAFSGGGSDTSAILTANLSNGGVTAVNMTDNGSGYSTATVVFGAPSGGVTATGTAILGVANPEHVASVAIANPGSGYVTAPSVTFTPVSGGSGAAAHTVIQNGVVVQIVMDNDGGGYLLPPTVTIGAPGGGVTATGTPIIVATDITGVTITDPGSGYVTAPSVTFSGDGSSATGTAIISASSIEGVTVVDGGSGFLFAPNITFVGGGGHSASGIVTLTGTSIAKIDVVNGGSNYQAVPDVKIVGGGGSNAAATAVLSGGQVVQINVTNAGTNYVTNPEIVIKPASSDPGTGATAIAIFAPTSIASVMMSNYGLQYTSAPAIVIQPGANNSAYANLDLMPFGVSGNAIETYQSRVFISYPDQGPFSTLPPGGNFAVSAPDSLTDFSTADGGLLYTNSDRFLQTQYVGLRQSNGYLYALGDGSVSVISNLQTSGSPSTTTFNYQNVDPQVGMTWRDSQEDFSRTILFANLTGVYGLYGGAVSKVSTKIDDLFLNAVFPSAGGVTPCAAVATIFNIKHYMLLMTIMDPDTGMSRNVLSCWNEREWTVASQSVSFTFIGTQKIGSKLFAWGTDGTSMYPLFATPSSTLIKRIDTKLYGGNAPFMIKDLVGFYTQARDLSSAQAGVALSVGLDVGGIAYQNPNFPSVPTEQYPSGLLQPPSFAPGGNTAYFPVAGVGSGGVPFIVAGFEITTSSPDFILANLMIAYINQNALA